MQTSELTLLRDKQTNEIAATKDGSIIWNITTRQTSTKEPTAFVIPLHLNAMHQQNEHLIKLIKQLGLEIEK